MDMRCGGRRANDRAVFLGRSHDLSHYSEKAQSEERAFTGLILDLRMERHEPSPYRRSSTVFYGLSGAYDAQDIVQGAANPGSAGCFVGPRKSRPRLDSFCNAVDRAHASPPPRRAPRPTCRAGGDPPASESQYPHSPARPSRPTSDHISIPPALRSAPVPGGGDTRGPHVAASPALAAATSPGEIAVVDAAADALRLRTCSRAETS